MKKTDWNDGGKLACKFLNEKPIIFNSEMVQAVLDGRKTQTRRIVKRQPGWNERIEDLDSDGTYPGQCFAVIGNSMSEIGCPYGQPGDRLIVCMEIPEFKGYIAGTNGVIYSKARGEWRPLKSFGKEDNYANVTVMDGKRKTTRNVHTLVCSAFYGIKPSKGSQVRHLDGNKNDNFPCNLAWGDQYDNWQDRKSHGNGMAGENHPAAKFSDEERSHIRWAVENGLCSQKQAARILKVSQASIYQLLKGIELKTVVDDELKDRVPLITLEIVNVKVERLNDISEEDAKAEGLIVSNGSTYREEFYLLWESIYSKGSWELNPWVWVIEFKRI